MNSVSKNFNSCFKFKSLCFCLGQTVLVFSLMSLLSAPTKAEDSETISDLSEKSSDLSDTDNPCEKTGSRLADNFRDPSSTLNKFIESEPKYLGQLKEGKDFGFARSKPCLWKTDNHILLSGYCDEANPDEDLARSNYSYILYDFKNSRVLKVHGELQGEAGWIWDVGVQDAPLSFQQWEENWHPPTISIQNAKPHGKGSQTRKVGKKKPTSAPVEISQEEMKLQKFAHFLMAADRSALQKCKVARYRSSLFDAKKKTSQRAILKSCLCQKRAPKNGDWNFKSFAASGSDILSLAIRPEQEPIPELKKILFDTLQSSKSDAAANAPIGEKPPPSGKR